MAIRLPPVHALAAFEAAARRHSFALAAEELCITPSALSHRIRLLEEFVSAKLFHRDGRSIEISEFGRRYLEVVRVALRTLSDFPMPQRTTGIQKKVRVLLPPTFTRHLLLPHIDKFMQEYPDITVELNLSVPLYDMSFTENDVEIRFGNGNYPGMTVEKLYSEVVFPVVSPAYLKTLPAMRTPADLRHARLLFSAIEPWQQWFDAAGIKDPLPEFSKLRIDDLGLMLEAVRLGYGIALTRKSFAREMLDKQAVVPLFDVQLDNPSHAYYVVHDPSARKREEVDVFVNWLLQFYRKAE